ncbi:hypothetical protein GC098_13590 [Paenibacillus sp. LMG 31458]|uniref:Uncharacterized protein n=1 Tax=Paenibacillus phytorum TaxID=2654977 RepID=A0ABX1XV74_9BACL|nr:hypothetical protein [Paenibacillus phytorum]
MSSNLTKHGGLQSGFMITQYAAASVVFENKSLAHPASVCAAGLQSIAFPLSGNVHIIQKIQPVIGLDSLLFKHYM